MKKPYTAQSDKLPHGAQWERENAYLYEDAGGKLIFSKIRYAARFKIGGQPVININTGKPRKKFEEVWPGHKTKPEYAPRMLYRLPELRRALFGKMRIFVVEGEAKVDLLIYKWKIAATCSEYGAGSWTDAHSEELRGAEVVILPDNDQAGRDHADEVGRSLINVAASVHLLELPGLPEHGDILDWVQAGGTKEQFVKLAEADRIWSAYGPPKPKAGKEFEVEHFNDIPMEPVSWFWPDFIVHQKVNVFFGPPETGKSTLTLSLVAKSTKGADWPDGGKAPQGRWIIFSAEDDVADTIAPRLAANGADLNMVCRLKMAGRWFDLTHDLPALRAAIQKLGDVIGVVIDPASAYLSKPGKADSHRQSDVRAILGPLGELAAECKLTIIVILHPHKTMKDNSVLNWMSGSSAFGEAPRIVNLIVPDPEDPGRMLFLRAKNNLVQHTDQTGLAFQLVNHEVKPGINAAEVLWLAEPIKTSAHEAMTSYNRPDDDRKSATEVREWLEALLHQGAMAQKDVEEAGAKVGITTDQLRRARERLKETIGTRKAGDHWEWYLSGGRGDPMVQLLDTIPPQGNGQRPNPESAE